jgi:TetR/AcrR family transcriptional regulator, cholesterol catabolism regulator
MSVTSRRGVRGRRQTTVESDRRLRQIIDKAAALFDRYGYSYVSMDDIADAVGLRKPSLYHYIRSKDEILVLIHREFMALVHARAASPERAAMSPTQELIEMMTDIFELMRSHRGHVRVFFEHYRELPPQGKATIASERERYEDLMRSIVARGIEIGEFRQIDVRLATLAVFGMCNWAYQWYRPSGELTPREIAGRFADYLLNGILGDTDLRLSRSPSPGARPPKA